MNNYVPITCSDLIIKPFDLEFIEEICSHRDYRIDDIDLRDMLYATLQERVSPLDITNYIIFEIFNNAVSEHVEDEGDAEKLYYSIYVNCLDSGFNIEPSELDTDQAKEFLEAFNNRSID